jgi:hypothetical protein
LGHHDHHGHHSMDHYELIEEKLSIGAEIDAEHQVLENGYIETEIENVVCNKAKKNELIIQPIEVILLLDVDKY